MSTKSVKLFIFDDVLNFGDLLNVLLAEKYLSQRNKQVQYVSHKECNAMFVGSILQLLWSSRRSLLTMSGLRFLHETVNVWGSGLISPITKPVLTRKLNIYALRGKLTLSILKNQSQRGGIQFLSNSLGDPGLLSNLIYDCSDVQKEYSLGVIPHYVDKDLKILDVFRGNNDVNIIDVQNSPENVITEIAKCNRIVSSSLHGLIVADSLNIPNARMILSNQIVGGDFKYMDYYSVFKSGQRLVLESNDLCRIMNDLKKVDQNYNVSFEEVLAIQNKLQESLEMYLAE